MTDVGDGIGTVATGALIAQEIDRARHEQPAVGHAAHEPCANCGTIRMGAYCHACGQAGHVHRDIGALVHDVAHGVFHFEGRIWRTLPLLAWHPGRLTRRYVDGERARFVSPMALFLFSVFLMFAVVANLANRGGGGAAELVGAGHPATQALAETDVKLAALRRQRDATADIGARTRLDERIGELAHDRTILATLGKAGFAGGDGRSGGLLEPKVLTHADVHTGAAWLDDMVIHAARNPELLLYKMKSYGYKYSWALIPLSLPFIWLLFAFRRDVGLYDHAIFAIYSLSFMSLAVVVLTVLSVAGLPGGLIALAALIVPPVHMYRQLKGTYRLGRFGAAWRTLALLGTTVITSALFLTFLFWLGSE